jgi:KDO2-lipid IV(A) lauroyltransferase
VDLRDRFVYWMFRLTILLMRPLPTRLAYRIAGVVAVACYQFVFPRHRGDLRENLSHVLPGRTTAEIDAVGRRSFRQFGKFVIDFIRYPSMTEDEVRRRLKFEQWTELEQIGASGRGAIIVTLHYGSWDLGAAALATLGHKVNAVAATFAYPPMNNLVQGSRARLGMRVLGTERVGVEALRALRRGEMLAMLIDAPEPDAGTVSVDFCGAPAVVASAPARVALHTGAWVVPAVVVRGPDDDLDIRPFIDASLRDYAPSGDEDRDVRDLTQLIMRSLEPHVRERPDQWFVFHPLWRTEAGQAVSTQVVERPT